MILEISNIRAKAAAVHGWYEADIVDVEIYDDEDSVECIKNFVGRFYVGRPNEVELVDAASKGVVGDIIRSRDPEHANIFKAFEESHAQEVA